MPLYYPDSLVRIHTHADFFISPTETSLQVGLYAALWNLRPILLSDLGEKVAEVTASSVLADLRNAYLRLADPNIRVRPGRLGKSTLTETAETWRSQEIGAWQPLSGRVFAPMFAAAAHARLDANSPWILTNAELKCLGESIEQTEDLLGKAAFRAVGNARVDFDTSILFNAPLLAEAAADPAFLRSFFVQQWGNVIAAHVPAAILGSRTAISTPFSDGPLAKVA